MRDPGCERFEKAVEENVQGSTPNAQLEFKKAKAQSQQLMCNSFGSSRARRLLQPPAYVQPRRRKITSRIGSGIPSSQSKIYPVAPACLILSFKFIDLLFLNNRAGTKGCGCEKEEQKLKC
jgi:hypothetical protein